tara:strand:- start:340 stop:1611 length:1272 start_codon:yes stop_codon:yes gene_type:complete
MDILKSQIRDFLPNFFTGKPINNSHRELSKSVNANFVLFNKRLHLLESGEFEQVSDDFCFDELASKSKKLLNHRHDQVSIQLLLPSGDFLSTRHALPDLPKESLVSALRLQAEETLPSFEKAVAIAFDSSKSDAEEETIVLWHDQEKLDNLFVAFKQQGLFLAVIKPRILAFEFEDLSCGVLERDEVNETLVIFGDGRLKVWRQVHKIDLDQEELGEQWRASLSEYKTTPVHGVDNFHKLKQFFTTDIESEYGFFPSGAVDARKKIDKGRKMILAGAISVALLCVAASPFLLQSIEFRRAGMLLEATRLMSKEARQDQLVVVNFETQWGPLNDFPEQRLTQAMFTLQNVLSPERLSAIEVSEGLIKLQGTSSDPQAILQKLEEDPLFTEVLFSRATSNSRYYIDLRLSPVNFEAYMVRYFSED